MQPTSTPDTVTLNKLPPESQAIGRSPSLCSSFANTLAFQAKVLVSVSRSIPKKTCTSVGRAGTPSMSITSGDGTPPLLPSRKSRYVSGNETFIWISKSATSLSSRSRPCSSILTMSHNHHLIVMPPVIFWTLIVVYTHHSTIARAVFSPRGVSVLHYDNLVSHPFCTERTYPLITVLRGVLQQGPCGIRYKCIGIFNVAMDGSVMAPSSLFFDFLKSGPG